MVTSEYGLCEASRVAREALARRDSCIRAARNAGLSLRQIARETGLSAEGIRQICKCDPREA